MRYMLYPLLFCHERPTFAWTVPSAHYCFDGNYGLWGHCRLKAGVDVSLMHDLTAFLGRLFSLCQPGDRLGYQAVLMRPAIQAISHLSIYHQVPKYYAGFGSTWVSVSGWLVELALRVFEPN